MKVDYYYLSNKEYDGSVFQTQIIDWLNLYDEEGVKFNLIQFKHPKDLLKNKKNKGFNKTVSGLYTGYMGFVWHFPNTPPFYFLNVFFLIIKLRRSIFSKRKILLFGRVLIGNEIRILKLFFGRRVEFIFDARAASAEEIKYIAQKEGDFNSAKIKLYDRVKNLENCTIENSYKTFCVSNKLIDYFIEEYKFTKNKFFLYPCLSDSKKFLFSKNQRELIRADLGIIESEKLIIYSGGFSEGWHLNDEILNFFIEINNFSSTIKFLILTKDTDNAFKLIQKKAINKDIITIIQVPNIDVFKYLSAADFGILFRDNTPMNEVSSPSKFPEYMLCGLPTLISDNIGDFSADVQKLNFGKIVHSSNKFSEEIGSYILNSDINRADIYKYAIKNYSKKSRLSEILIEFMNVF